NMSQKEALEKILVEFESKLKNIMNSSLDHFIADYLPYAQYDLEFNVFSYSRQLIEDFLTDKTTYSWHTDVSDIFKELNSKEVRRKMLKEYREELMNDIIKDQAEMIKSLMNRVDELEEMLWSNMNR